MAPRPTEVKALVALLSEEHEDVEELAKTVILRLDELRKDRPQYVVGARFIRGDSTGHTMIYGPYPTPKGAEKVGTKLVAPSAGSSWGVYRLYPEVSDGT